jgi:hypothetical protein
MNNTQTHSEGDGVIKAGEQSATVAHGLVGYTKAMVSFPDGLLAPKDFDHSQPFVIAIADSTHVHISIAEPVANDTAFHWTADL